MSAEQLTLIRQERWASLKIEVESGLFSRILLSVLAMNLLRRFQMETTAAARPRTRKRTFLYVLESIEATRFTWLNVAGRLVATNGTRTLRLSDVAAIRRRYESLEQALASVA